jgi:hypothetical protein
MNSKKQLEILIDDSYDELTSLLKWFSLFGPIPTIIGGWAVYFYNSYFGSIDIDIVGPSHQGRFMEIIERYERTHGYEYIAKDQLRLEVTSRKPVIQNGRVIGYMEIDACTFEDPKPGNFHEDPNKQLPYSLTAKKQHQKEVKLEEDAICYIPSKPLLLLYKIKAARDRVYDLKTGGTIMEPAKLERLRGKVTKDRADVLALLDPNPSKIIVEEGFDINAFYSLVKEFNLEFMLTTITELPRYRDSIQLYNPNLKIKQIQEWIKTIAKS